MSSFRIGGRRIGALVALLVVGTVGTAYGSITLASSSGEFSSTLVAAHSGKCLDASRAGRQLRQVTCSATVAAQRFDFAPADAGGYTVKAGDRCVEVRATRSTNGSPASTATCTGAANQRFTLREATGGAQLVAASTGRCLDVSGGSQANGAPVIQWACGDPKTAGNQIWKVTDVPGGVVTPTVTPTTSSPSSSASPTASTTTTSAASPTPTTTSAASTSTTTTAGGGTVTPGAGGTNPDWGKAGPPAGAVLSRAYQLVLGGTEKGYLPRTGECSIEVHARYWTWGPDGKVYPTWHPARDASGCSFGHEHGDDPRTSNLFARTGWDPYGYTNEQLAPSNPSSQRNEDHVGHKQAVANGIVTHLNNDSRQRVDMTCDALLKFHQGTHSPDALTNNLHELFYNVRCTYSDNGAVTDTNFRVLLPIGHPGSVNVNNLCDGNGLTVHKVGTADPANSPDGGFSSRRLPDADCAASVAAGNGTTATRIDELWQLEFHVRGAGQLQRFDFNPYMIVGNPSRYYDPASPTNISRTVDLCAKGAKGADCDKVRSIIAQTGQALAFDDPRSPFNGGRRHFDPNRFVVQNNGPTTLYTDVFGQRFSTTPFAGSIQQFISGNHAEDGTQGDIFMPFKDRASNPADGIHAPN